MRPNTRVSRLTDDYLTAKRLALFEQPRQILWDVVTAYAILGAFVGLWWYGLYLIVAGAIW